MECIVHFEVMQGDEPKQLRGLILLGKDELPGEENLLRMFARMEYDVYLDDEEQMLFKPVDPSAPYRWVRVRELDMGEQEGAEDRDLNSVVANLLPSRNRHRPI